MSLLGPIGHSPAASLISRLPGANRDDAPLGPVKLPGVTAAPTPAVNEPGGFGSVFEQLVSSVDAKQDEAQALTRDVLLGQNDQLHQSMIAMQEAGVAFQLMVEVRNKVVESYQELMRMPV
jgi:flagellar hook-basal body complex protein FliE